MLDVPHVNHRSSPSRSRPKMRLLKNHRLCFGASKFACSKDQRSKTLIATINAIKVSEKESVLIRRFGILDRYTVREPLLDFFQMLATLGRSPILVPKCPQATCRCPRQMSLRKRDSRPPLGGLLVAIGVEAALLRVPASESLHCPGISRSCLWPYDRA